MTITVSDMVNQTNTLMAAVQNLINGNRSDWSRIFVVALERVRYNYEEDRVLFNVIITSVRQGDSSDQKNWEREYFDFSKASVLAEMARINGVDHKLEDDTFVHVGLLGRLVTFRLSRA